ncbi:MAG TPA: nucleoside-diphosphate sugar epimerase/dehydratase [Anaerolineales bacterium]|nr:nucleoside-diphosphate sugar epimerase/dehydratase [Anaerolineales bacterium]HRQ91755.1 nucleoside-diphosphate sugar epimerase/dehydratase [Anaerolineales bacterium]
MRIWIRTNRLFFADLVLVAASMLGAFLLRLTPEQFILDYLPTFLWMLAVALLVKPFMYKRGGLYERVWAYASIAEMKLIVRAVSIASLIMAPIVFLLDWLGAFSNFARSLVVIDWLLSLAAVGGLRFGLRLLAENRKVIEQASGVKLRRAIILGAGDAGALVARELQKNQQLGLNPLAFLDDDPEKQGQRLHGIPVVGTLKDLPAQAAALRAEEVIMAIPSAPGSVLRQAADLSRQAGIPYRTMPGLYELIGGKVSVSRLREVDITDLLRRQPAQIDRARVGDSLRGKRVLITGAGGSIASELGRQIARWEPAMLVLLGHGENSIFEILLELHNEYPQLEIIPVIADVRDAGRISAALKSYKPDIVFHAAAHKHVPLMEANIAEAVANNVQGTLNVVQAAGAAGVQRLVMISTDKAVRPSSVMGATKRVAEWAVLDAARTLGRNYSVVRFGNVLGSRGSVVPLFKHQIAQGGPLTITHPEMERYFMTIPEAVHLVLQAAAFEGQGELYMLDMGQPVRIVDLAEDLIRLSGLTPGEDIQIEFSGLRPGEKLSEQLWEAGGEYSATTHPDIRRVQEPQAPSREQLHAALSQLLAMAEANDSSGILTLLGELLPGSEVGQAPPPAFTSLS